MQRVLVLEMLIIQSRPQSAPVRVRVIQRPYEQDGVDYAQPQVNASVIRLDMTAPEVLRLLVMGYVFTISTGLVLIGGCICTLARFSVWIHRLAPRAGKYDTRYLRHY